MFTAIEATTDELRHKALQIRYEVFYREGGDARYADHERQIWVDQDDGPQSRIVVGLDSNGEVVGTMRLTRLSDWPFIAHEAYDFKLLASFVGIAESELRQSVARVDRVVVSQSSRGEGVFTKMQTYMEYIACSSSCSVIIAAQSLHNNYAQRAFLKLGWIKCPHVSTYKGFTAQHIYKDLRNLNDNQ
ncbi:GNAT family N-acetyltransferase [Schlesneria sp. DSM 10557]|uniref:GNAT family N-acetyltransferase n=1 Tax=Schlesneria sp. DSM 10557 TaxID=3044399 RepID=UPI00359FD1D4